MKIPLFDIDWTLIKGGNKAHMNGMDFAMKKVYGVEASVGEIVTDGMIDNQIMLEVLKLHGLDETTIKEKIEEADRAATDYFMQNEHEGECIPMPGAIELLKSLKENHGTLGLLTGNIEPVGWRKVEIAGLKEYFDFGAFGNLAYRRVDLIAIAQKRVSELLNRNVQLNELVIIGDTPLDVACAKQGGIQSIAVGAGIYSAEQLQVTGADLVVKSLEEKEKIINFLAD